MAQEDRPAERLGRTPSTRRSGAPIHPEAGLFACGTDQAMNTRRHATNAIALLLCAGSAHADFTGFGSNSYVVEGDLHTYHIMELYATFDDPSDRLLNAFDMSIRLVNDSDPDAPVVFFQASEPDLGIAESFLPLGFQPPGEAWLFDSYITVGAEQRDWMNGTVPDPGFADAKFVQGNAIADDAGWYNLPPTNGFGLAGDGLKVLLGVFVVTGENYTPGLALQVSGTVGVASGGELQFGTSSRQLFYPSGLAVEYIADQLDTDGHSDVLFFNPVSNQIAGWLMDDLVRKAGAVFPDIVPAGYTVQGMGDLDGNASTDILWRDADGRFHAWLTNGLEVIAKAPISVALEDTWQCVALGDISGDGRGDIVLRNWSTGEVRVWMMEGFTKIVEGSLGYAPARTCEAIADFDGDGHQDLLWRSSTGIVSVWLLNGLDTPVQGNVTNVSGPVSAGWRVAGAADITGDGRADVVWRHQTVGTVTAWVMDGTARVTGGLLHPGIPTVWRIEALRDIDDDGRYDILWRNAQTGDMNGWIMNGLAKDRGGFIRNANMQWAIVVP
jgi:hypothetical protein